MVFVRFISGFALVAGLIWFVPAAWALFFRDQMDGQDAYRRVMAGCAMLGLACLVAIYDQLLVIGRQLDRRGPSAK